jgi:HAD superfamily hydrolase (TIGR01509 family)
MTLKAVLFDHDGTLVDSEGMHWLHWQQVLERYGVEFPESLYKEHYSGVPVPANAVTLTRQYGINISAVELAQQKNEATRTYLAQQAFPLMPHAAQAVAFFHQKGLKLAVVTGANLDGVTATLEAYGLSDVFDLVVTGSDVKHSKPAPDCYLLALEKLGLQAEECIAIEDTEHGVRAAVSAGIACCGVPNAISVNHDFSLAIQTFQNLELASDWISLTFGLDHSGK